MAVPTTVGRCYSILRDKISNREVPENLKLSRDVGICRAFGYSPRIFDIWMKRDRLTPDFGRYGF
ncbi:MAG: hypothetical protein M0Z96_05885 [Actinomycetota bacterium]|nr:hypothetical protein [Actinomycetota bacterium]